MFIDIVILRIYFYIIKNTRIKNNESAKVKERHARSSFAFLQHMCKHFQRLLSSFFAPTPGLNVSHCHFAQHNLSGYLYNGHANRQNQIDAFLPFFWNSFLWNSFIQMYYIAVRLSPLAFFGFTLDCQDCPTFL